MTENTGEALREVVRERYGAAATRVAEGKTAISACGSSGCCGSTTESWDPITSDIYEAGQTAGIPAEALLASLGSGGGIDVLLSAKRVGPTGKAYGLDMTDEMLALANENKRKAGATNVEFL